MTLFERLMRKLGYVKVGQAQENYFRARREFALKYTTDSRIRSYLGVVGREGNVPVWDKAKDLVWRQGELLFAEAVRGMRLHDPVEELPLLIVKEYGKSATTPE